MSPTRGVTVCLAGASEAYQTVITAWDEDMVRLGDEEEQQLRQEARKAAADKREQKVKDAASAF